MFPIFPSVEGLHSETLNLGREFNLEKGNLVMDGEQLSSHTAALQCISSQTQVHDCSDLGVHLLLIGRHIHHHRAQYTSLVRKYGQTFTLWEFMLPYKLFSLSLSLEFSFWQHKINMNECGLSLYWARQSNLGTDGLFERDLPASVALTGVTAQGPVQPI